MHPFFPQVALIPYFGGKMTQRLAMIQDSHQRILRKLRVSLLDRCNFRCFYCMPKNTTFMPPSEYLSPQKIESICARLVDLGITHLRVTGGEPTLRKEFIDIMGRLGKLPIEKFCITSNGFILGKYLNFLKEINCKYINISCDSLIEDKFNKITLSSGFKNVYKTILRARDLGFEVKINTLLLKNINDDEIFDFIQFSAKENIEVRFLEMMKIGLACKYSIKNFLSAQEAIDMIQKQEKLTQEYVEHDSTSFNYNTSSGARIGFIASETRPFCGSCSRLRLSAKGLLMPCLLKEEGVDFKNLPENTFEKVLKEVIEKKPISRIIKVRHTMNQVGG